LGTLYINVLHIIRGLTVFSSRTAFHNTVLEASKYGALGVRAALLSITGSLSVSYAMSWFCVCGCKFSFEHFLSCPSLGSCTLPTLELAVAREDWKGASVVILSRFEVYFHAGRGGELRTDECDLFSALNESLCSDEELGFVIE
jgi:hypothetical protein